MPYVKRNIGREVAPNHEYLVESLTNELKNEPKPKSLARDVFHPQNEDAPDIIEEQSRKSNYLHVYVIWKDWSGIREDYRSAAILDAYERQLGKEYAGRILVALGLTPEEAKSLGVHAGGDGE